MEKTLNHYDVVIIGGGLFGSSLGYFLKKFRPEIQFVILEKENRTYNKTWSFHQSDFTNEEFELFRPFISFEWKSYSVNFEKTKEIPLPYCTIQSKKFFEIVDNAIGENLIIGQEVVSVDANGVKSANGHYFSAPLLFDTRDSAPISVFEMIQKGWGFQKFFGQDVQLESPHGLTHPILMDASVHQSDGFRFMYVLPLGEKELLIEETRYSNEPNINSEEARLKIHQYAHDNHGWKIQTILREESAALPIPTTSYFKKEKTKIHFDQLSGLSKNIFKIGSGGGFFHPVTGYSLLWCAKLTIQIAKLSELNSFSVQKLLDEQTDAFKKNEAFYLFLNHLMFHAATTTNRINIFRRFYKLPLNTIERFYQSQTNRGDMVRLLVGRPPVPIKDALKAIFYK